MENMEMRRMTMEEELRRLLNEYIAPMPEVLQNKYRAAIEQEDVAVLLELSEKIENRIAYEREKSADRSIQLQGVLTKLQTWLDRATQ
jgi:hypothetical protein